MWTWASTHGFNKICFVLHLFFGALLLVESIAELNVGGYSTKLELIYIRLNGTNWPDRVYSVERAGDFNIVACLAGFSLITAATHFWYMYSFSLGGYSFVDNINPIVWSFDYTKGKPKSLDYRYFEYAVTAPLMILIITVLFGIREIWTLLSIFTLISATMFFGALQSWASDDLKAWPHIFGWVPYIPAWAIIFVNFGLVVRDNDDVPDFVWIVLFLEFVLFGAFGLVQFFYDAWPKINDYKECPSQEKSDAELTRGVRIGNNDEDDPVYCKQQRELDGLNNVLSLVSKILLVCILYFNFISLENMSDN
jgi:hypothetical protein